MAESFNENGKNRGAAGLPGLLVGLGFFVFVLGATQPAPAQHGGQEAKRIFARAKAEDFKGDDFCLSCHEEKVNAFKYSGHAAFMTDSHLSADKRGCEGCHGAGGVHQDENNPEVVSFTTMSPKESSAACLRCHANTMSESHWKKTAHANADVACVSCHQIHPDSASQGEPESVKSTADPKTAGYAVTTPAKHLLKAEEGKLCGSCHNQQKAQFRLPSHHPLPEGRVACSDCHSIHPSKGAKVRHQDIKQDCASCHVEYKGPFVYEHDPMSGGTGEGCLECHRPHGSQNPKLLGSFSRGLCAQCHTEKLASHFPGHKCWDAGCHASPHGSNTDALFRRP